jgi:hypothetical protein
MHAHDVIGTGEACEASKHAEHVDAKGCVGET